MSTDTLLSGNDLAEILGIPARTVNQWRYLGRGPAYIRVGRHIRYRRADIEQWLAEQTATPANGGR